MENVRWDRLSQRDKVPSLLDSAGTLWSLTELVAKKCRPSHTPQNLRLPVHPMCGIQRAVWHTKRHSHLIGGIPAHLLRFRIFSRRVRSVTKGAAESEQRGTLSFDSRSQRTFVLRSSAPDEAEVRFRVRLGIFGDFRSSRSGHDDARGSDRTFIQRFETGRVFEWQSQDRLRG